MYTDNQSFFEFHVQFCQETEILNRPIRELKYIDLTNELNILIIGWALWGTSP